MKKKTIEKRAEEYADMARGQYYAHDCLKDAVSNATYSNYIIGATEQREIDINKAVKWLVNHECFGCEDSVLATAFREAMMEE